MATNIIRTSHKPVIPAYKYLCIYICIIIRLPVQNGEWIELKQSTLEIHENCRKASFVCA